MLSFVSFAMVIYATASFFRRFGPAAGFGLMLALGLVGAILPAGGALAGLLAAGAAWSAGGLRLALPSPRA